MRDVFRGDHTEVSCGLMCESHQKRQQQTVSLLCLLTSITCKKPGSAYSEKRQEAHQSTVACMADGDRMPAGGDAVWTSRAE